MKKHFKGISEEQAKSPIYRFTTIDRVCQLFVQRKNILVSPSKWDDPFENMLSRLIVQQGDGQNFKHPLRNRVYAQCWTLTEETDATWRIYVPRGNGVRMKTTVSKLHKSLWDDRGAQAKQACYIGKVDYKTEEEIEELFSDKTWILNHLFGSGPDGPVDSLLFKRMAFQPEHEIRLIFLDFSYEGKNHLFEYKIDPSDIILDITFDPRVDDSVYETYSSILRQVGYNGKITKSTLYRVPDVKVSV